MEVIMDQFLPNAMKAALNYIQTQHHTSLDDNKHKQENQDNQCNQANTKNMWKK